MGEMNLMFAIGGAVGLIVGFGIGFATGLASEWKEWLELRKSLREKK